MIRDVVGWGSDVMQCKDGQCTVEIPYKAVWEAELVSVRFGGGRGQSVQFELSGWVGIRVPSWRIE